MGTFSTTRDRKFVATYGMIGDSGPMREIFAKIPKCAHSVAPVLITGETGTGKELIAKAIHKNSSRASGPFIAVNCAALPQSLIQSELFGHEKGAYTGADKRAIGKFEAAHGGTLLLDEIGDLPPEIQVNLLRTLETGTIERLGSADSVSVDIRIITATHIDLQGAIEAGDFREDLYYRLNVLGIRSPPLRERKEDIELLAEYFFDRFTDNLSRHRLIGFSDEARRAMRQWHWPGNVRELRNSVLKAVTLDDRGPISRRDLGLERRRAPRIGITLDEARQAAELAAILTALDRSSGNVTLAAQQLGVCRMTLYRLMERHNIDYSDGEINRRKLAEVPCEAGSAGLIRDNNSGH
jgi:DNA-binding NtrC family response regulator